MRERRESRSALRSSALAASLLLIGLTTGCASWQVAERTPQQVFLDQRPEQVRVTTRDGVQTVLAQPRVLGEVLAGYDARCLERWGIPGDRCSEMGVPIFDIATLEIRRRSAVSFMLPAAGGILAVWLLMNR